MNVDDMEIETAEVNRDIARVEERMAALDAMLKRPDGSFDGEVIRAQGVVEKELRSLQRKRQDILAGLPQPTYVPPTEPAQLRKELRDPFRISPKDFVPKKVEDGSPGSEELQREFTAIFQKHAEFAIEAIDHEFQESMQGFKNLTTDRSARYSQANYIAMLLILARLNAEIHALAEFQRGRRREMEARLDALEARPSVKYWGVWKEGKAYGGGSMVTDKGSVWYAEHATMQRPGASDDWGARCKARR